MQIMGEAENKLLTSLIEHYERVVPKLQREFNELYSNAADTLSPLDKRLLVIQLAHFKNELVKEKIQPPIKKPVNTQQDPNEQGRQVTRGNPPNRNQNRGQNQQEQDWNMANTEQSSTWEERPKPQRSNTQFRRGRERARNQQRW
jgi:hypothetical protein